MYNFTQSIKQLSICLLISEYGMEESNVVWHIGHVISFFTSELFPCPFFESVIMLKIFPCFCLLRDELQLVALVWLLFTEDDFTEEFFDFELLEGTDWTIEEGQEFSYETMVDADTTVTSSLLSFTCCELPWGIEEKNVLMVAGFDNAFVLHFCFTGLSSSKTAVDERP